MNQPEYYECTALVEYLELIKNNNEVLYSHTAQETYTSSWNQKRKNKALGVKSGVPDYIIVINKKLLFIEMKRPKKILKSGKESTENLVKPEQAKWTHRINETGVKAYICHGFDEAKEVIDQYIN